MRKPPVERRVAPSPTRATTKNGVTGVRPCTFHEGDNDASRVGAAQLAAGPATARVHFRKKKQTEGRPPTRSGVSPCQPNHSAHTHVPPLHAGPPAARGLQRRSSPFSSLTPLSSIGIPQDSPPACPGFSFKRQDIPHPSSIEEAGSTTGANSTPRNGASSETARALQNSPRVRLARLRAQEPTDAEKPSLNHW